jgi:hypothetical protein
MEKPSKLELYFWHSLGFIIKMRKIIIGVLVTLLAVACIYTFYTTPAGFYDKPIPTKPVKPVKVVK